MRIAYVSAHYAPFIGGVEKHVTEIAKRAATRGHDVHVLTHREPRGEVLESEVLDGVRVHRFPVPVPSRNYAISPALWAHLTRSSGHYDVVHGHGYHALPALAAALAKRGPFVFTPHYHGTGHSAFRKALHPPYRALLGRQLFGRADRTISVSPPEAELILRHFPEIRAKLTVIPNGVDLEAMHAAEPFEVDRTVVLSAGRIESYKQVDKTVAAVASMDESYMLRVTGDGPARAEAEALAGRLLGDAERIAFLGRVSDDELLRWFRTADVFVSMSSNEAMPITVIEVLAAGARVIASDIPAHRDLVEKTAGTIHLVPLDASPEQLAAMIRTAMNEPPRAPRIDTWDDVTERTLQVYDGICSKR